MGKIIIIFIITLITLPGCDKSTWFACELLIPQAHYRMKVIRHEGGVVGPMVKKEESER